MGLLDKLKGELIDIIEWMDEGDDTLAYRFERYGNEIKNGAQLTVREGQAAAFINEGQLADIFEPGHYELTTKNLPILSTLKGWKYGFQSPFKAEVYFISTKIIDGFRWGTPGPFRIRDREFGILELLARGSFNLRVIEPVKFIKDVVGTDGEFTKDDIKDRLRKRFVTEAISAIAGTGKSFYEMANAYSDLAQELKNKVGVIFWEKYGISLEEVNISNIDLTEKSAEKVEKRDDLMFSDGRMDMYERKGRIDALNTLAGNEGAGGMAANMMGMGVGMGMANQMGNQMGGGMTTAPPPPPPPPGYYLHINGQQQGPYPLQTLMQLVQQGSLTMESNVWKPGMPAWAAAGSVPDLARLFQQVPPPPPPPPMP